MWYASFKEAMTKWIMNPETKDISWANISFCVINAKINGCALSLKDGKSPYEIYYGKHNSNIASYVLGDIMLDQAKTKYGLKAIETLMEEIGNVDASIQIPITVVHELIREADELYEKEARVFDGKKSSEMKDS
jgi:hypothetical protein